jgi:hypothetical protein
VVFTCTNAQPKPAPAGTKPPPSEQLPDEVGILITGCQDRETSADACPSGDKAKAHGALSNALHTVVRQHHEANPGKPLTYRQACMRVEVMVADRKASLTFMASIRIIDIDDACSFYSPTPCVSLQEPGGGCPRRAGQVGLCSEPLPGELGLTT